MTRADDGELTRAQLRALEVLAHGQRLDRRVRSSDHTTNLDGLATLPPAAPVDLCVHHRVADTLEQLGLVERTDRYDFYFRLTDAGHSHVSDDALVPRPVVFRFAGRPPLLNAERSAHWSEHRETTAALRAEACLRARAARLAAMDEVEVRSWPTYADRRSWPDVAGWAPATKAVIDGLVDAGVLPNDTHTVVRRSTFDTPRLGTTDELVVALVPWARALGTDLDLEDAVEVGDRGRRSA